MRITTSWPSMSGPWRDPRSIPEFPTRAHEREVFRSIETAAACFSLVASLKHSAAASSVPPVAPTRPAID